MYYVYNKVSFISVVHAANSLAKNTLAGQEHILGLTIKYEKRL